MAQAQCHVLNPFDNAIDLSTTDGHKIYKEGIKPLDDRFDGSSDKATFFQTKVIDASESRFWAAICKLEFNGEDVDMLKQPGKLSMEDLKVHYDEIWEGDINDDDTYQDQIRHSMMGTFLIESITPALRQRIQAKKNQWFYGAHNAIDGLILFKILIGYGAIGSWASIDKNKTKLQQLKLKAYEHDVVKLMDDFEATLAQIESKGETFSDHTLCLFKAFATSHDPIFKNYVQTFKDKWDDGEDITWTVLAEKAMQKYKALHEAGIWKSTDAQKQQIVALTSAIQTMTKAMGSNPHPKKPPEPPKKPGGGGPLRGPKTPTTERGAPEYAAWKTTPPKPGESKEMQKGPWTSSGAPIMQPQECGWLTSPLNAKAIVPIQHPLRQNLQLKEQSRELLSST